MGRQNKIQNEKRKTYFENKISSGFVNLSAKLCSDTADISRDISPNP